MGKKSIAFIMTVLMAILLIACGNNTAKKADYTANTAESALNSGKNIDGKTIEFKAEKVIPNGELGHTIWAGKHLNFISSENPKISVEKGEVLIAKVKKAKSALGSWLITYSDLTKK